MRIIAPLLASLSLLAATPAASQTYVYEVEVEEWVETSASRFVSPPLERAESEAIASFGPFRVLDDNRAALVAVTTGRTIADFEAMLATYPEIDTLEFVECPGTRDDRANLQLGRMIRARNITAVVPEGGSVRSGAVDLFVAGASREIAPGAEFAVHAWLDERGMGAMDYAADSPEHTKYLSYYQEMGMAADEAADFYAMTNSVPFESARWLTGEEMRGWIETGEIATPVMKTPRLAYLDLGAALN